EGIVAFSPATEAHRRRRTRLFVPVPRASPRVCPSQESGDLRPERLRPMWREGATPRARDPRAPQLLLHRLSTCAAAQRAATEEADSEARGESQRGGHGFVISKTPLPAAMPTRSKLFIRRESAY